MERRKHWNKEKRNPVIIPGVNERLFGEMWLPNGRKIVGEFIVTTAGRYVSVACIEERRR